MKSSSREIRQEFIQLWARLGRDWGVSAATAKVYAWLMTRPAGGDTDEIMEGLKLGRGTVSMSCRELREWGLIVAEQLPGSRRTRHLVETDLLKVIRSIILHRKRREWDPILEHTGRWIPALEEDRSPEAGLFRERLRALRGCLQMADAAVDRFLGGESIDDVRLKALARPARPRRPEPPAS